LFGKSFIQKIALKPPFRFDFPVNEQACFLFVKEGEFQYQFDSEQRNIPANYSLFLNCIKSSKQIQNANSENVCEIVIVTFHPEILKQVYNRELPSLLQAPKTLFQINPAKKLTMIFNSKIH